MQENTPSCVWGATAGGRLRGAVTGIGRRLVLLAPRVPVRGLVLASWVGYLRAHAGPGAGYLGWLLACPLLGLVLATWVGYLGARAGPGAGYLGWLLGCPCVVWCWLLGLAT